MSHSAEHTPSGPVTIRSPSADLADDTTTTSTTKISSDQRFHIKSASTDKAAVQTNVPEVETSAAPQPDILNSTSKSPMDNVTSIQDLEEASCNCKVPASCGPSGDDITTVRVMPENDVTVEVTTSYDSISSTVMFVRASVTDNVSVDDYPDMNEFQLFRIGRNIE